jgi:hypothetical protein
MTGKGRKTTLLSFLELDRVDSLDVFFGSGVPLSQESQSMLVECWKVEEAWKNLQLVKRAITPPIDKKENRTASLPPLSGTSNDDDRRTPHTDPSQQNALRELPPWPPPCSRAGPRGLAHRRRSPRSRGRAR